MHSSEGAKQKYIWRFFRAGGLDQVKIEKGSDLVALDQLDQKLWVALSCPTRGLEFDSKTLDLIDSDKDGRIRAPEILQAVRWAVSCLKDPEELVKGGDTVPLDAINASNETGARLLAAARQALINLGKPDAESISIADVTDTARIFSQTQYNGDGVVSSDAVTDPEVKKVMVEIMGIRSGTLDRNGMPGISQADVDSFFKEARSYADWWQRATQPPAGAPLVLTFGDNTTAAYDAFKAVRVKVDDYFARCRVAAFDPRAAAPLNRAEAEFVAMAGKNFANYLDEVVNLPLSRIEASRPLPLTEGVNPAWQKALDRFRTAVVGLAFGPDKPSLSEVEWTSLVERFLPFETWLGAKTGASVEGLGLLRVQQILAGKTQDVLFKMIAQDLSVAPAMAEIANVEKLVRYHRDLFRLLNNFVCFSDFYAKDRLAIFQSGSLYIDGRSCHLCVKVADASAHAPMANLSRTYLAYCELNRPATKEKLTIAAAFTGGDSDQLRVGRNGIFYDRKGQDWDATVIKTVEHPISIRQAFWSPYKRIGRMVGDQVEKLASNREKAVMDKASAGIEQTAKTAVAGKPIEKPKIDTGTLAAIGMIMTGLIGALSTILGALVGLVKDAWWKVPLVVLGLILAVSGPSMIIAWLKLRTRDLAPILDGCGWAINGRVKLNMALGRILTEIAVVPGTAIRSLEDLYPDDPPKVPKWAWGLLIFVAFVAVLEFTGIFKSLGVDDWLYNHLWPTSAPLVEKR